MPTVAILCCALAAEAAAAERTVFPEKAWQEATPESQGVDSTRLKAAAAWMDGAFGPDGAKELVVIRNGRLIWKGPNADAYHNVWSATKTFTSTVLGVMAADGKCGLDDLAVKHLPSLDGQYPLYARIRLRHLASMSSGYKGEVVGVTSEQPWGEPTAYLRPTAPLFEAGTQVQYHDHQVFVLGQILTRLAGEPLKPLFKRRIADAIGMTRWDWGVSGKVDGIDLANAAGTPTTPGIQTTALEMARFGHLYLNRGNWNGKQLLPAWFVDEATGNQAPRAGRSAFLHGRYGFYWWTNDQTPDGTRRWPSAPPKTYTSHGRGANFCVVIPEWNMVVVRLGTEPIRAGAGGVKEVDSLWNAFFGQLALALGPAEVKTRTETFDREPADWEGVNHRSTHFAPKTVIQDFGYSPATRHAGGQPGEVGGRINPAGEAAYYGWRLPKPLALDDPAGASGTIVVRRGSGHFLLGFFNAGTLNEWRTPNTLAARINGRGEGFHAHLEYCTSRWRAGAGVIGHIVPGQRIEAKLLPSNRVYRWRLAYDPKDAGGNGLLTFTLDNETATCEIAKEHRADGARLTHFGLLPVLKSWDDAGAAWIDDVTVQGNRFDFAHDPKWDAVNNRRAYVTNNTRPRFDFGWSPTHFAGGKAAGELGGLIFRGDCREPHRMAAYGARLSKLSLDTPLFARGKVCLVRGVTDSTASIGFYHSTWSLRSNPAQDQSTPMDYVGVNIEGPSTEGFYFYPVYRVHGKIAGALGGGSGKAPRIYPDRKVHDWLLKYDPAGAGGRGRITVSLDGQTCTLDLAPGAKAIGASFDRFGICTPWIDGNSVTVYFDDIEFTR